MDLKMDYVQDRYRDENIFSLYKVEADRTVFLKGTSTFTALYDWLDDNLPVIFVSCPGQTFLIAARAYGFETRLQFTLQRDVIIRVSRLTGHASSHVLVDASPMFLLSRIREVFVDFTLISRVNNLFDRRLKLEYMSIYDFYVQDDRQEWHVRMVDNDHLILTSKDGKREYRFSNLEDNLKAINAFIVGQI